MKFILLGWGVALIFLIALRRRSYGRKQPVDKVDWVLLSTAVVVIIVWWWIGRRLP